MGGLNERPAPNALEAPNLAVCHALYQRNAGALQRLEGTKTLAALPNGVGVFGGAQLDDGTGNIVVQGDNGTEYLFTLDELFGRTVASNLTFLPLPDDNNMPTATLLQTATNGTDLADIGGATANTWYTRPLTSNPLNESSIVVAFVSGASATFEVAAGTYRIRGWVTAAFTLNNTAGAVNPTSAEAGFQCALIDTTTSTTVCIGSPASVKLTRNSTAAFNAELGPVNVRSFLDGTFTIAGPANSVLQLKNAFGATFTANGVVTASGGSAANVSTTLNGAALVQPYVCLNLAKVS